MAKRLSIMLMLVTLPAWPVAVSRWAVDGGDAGAAAPPAFLAAPRRGAPPGDPLRISERALKQRGSAWRRQLTGVPHWRFVRTDSVEMTTDARAADIRWTCFAVEWALPRVAAALGVESPPHMGVTLFARRASFDAYRGPYGGVEAESLYDPHRRRIVLCAEGERAARLAAVVHELVHALMHAGFGRTGPPWLAEGVAERVTAELLASLDERLAPAWDDVPATEPPSALMPLSGAEFTAEGAVGRYATAFSWVNYLIDGEGRSVRALLEWSPSPVEIEIVERRWRRHREAPVPAPCSAEEANRAAFR